ncbi:hypothetical protein WA026_004003 [Henosepilachna vigintioctopunctata]|uniref:Homeobox domain-containing protein n=1 Tax=Henosepilachna vigintioctopunctata TaxID=420089 RepID=A0AAW1UEZ4_9CUCU
MRQENKTEDSLINYKMSYSFGIQSRTNELEGVLPLPTSITRTSIARMTKSQLQELELQFDRNIYLTKHRKTKMTRELNLTEHQLNPGASTHQPTKPQEVLEQVPRLSTPTNAPTACNTPLSPTLGQLNYGTPCYPPVNSQKFYPNAITRHLETSFSEFGCNPSACAQHITTPLPPGVTPASYEPT